MGLFRKKKNKIDSKYQIGEFVSFHYNNDLKFGMIKDVKESEGNILYDIKVGGEATWLCENISENKIVKIDKN